MAVQSLGYWGYTYSSGKPYLGPMPSADKRKASTLDSLAPQEKLFLSFEKGKILKKIGWGKDIIQLPSSCSGIEEKQEQFRAWLRKNHPSQQFSDEELDVAMIVMSIWMKTKEFCKVHLKAKTAEDEKRRQAEADQKIFTGKAAFTSRQAVILLNTIIEFERSESGNTCLNVILGEAYDDF